MWLWFRNNKDPTIGYSIDNKEHMLKTSIEIIQALISMNILTNPFLNFRYDIVIYKTNSLYLAIHDMYICKDTKTYFLNIKPLCRFLLTTSPALWILSVSFSVRWSSLSRFVIFLCFPRSRWLFAFHVDNVEYKAALLLVISFRLFIALLIRE